jgi:hypothetical protein
MTIRNIRWSLMALGAAAALMSTSAHAVWTFDQTNVTGLANYQSCTTPGSGGCSVDGTLATTVDTTTVSLSGVYASNATSGSGGVVNGNWTSSPLVLYAGNGQGMSSDGSNTPNHALDNNGNTEAVLLNFSASTVLTSIGLGYVSNGQCSDGSYVSNNGTCPTNTSLLSNGSIKVSSSVFRWVGTGTPTGTPSPLLGQAANTMTGWELVGNYGNMGYDTSNPYNLVNSAGKTSSWWLISTYNSGFAQNTTNSSTSIATENVGTLAHAGNDYFKLFGAAGTKCTSTVNAQGVCGGSTTTSVPEPATLALTSAALIGMAGLRRRKARQAA